MCFFPVQQIPPPISSRLSKSTLAKSKYYKKTQSLDSKTQSFTQTTKSNIKDILKIKSIFLKLSARKIIEIYNIANNNQVKSK